jgi:hypothetical protein
MGSISSRAEYARTRIKMALGLIAVCALPLLGWYALRWAVIGEFGLVPIAGEALVGIVGQFLTDDVVTDLPEDLRPFGLKALENRAEWAAGKYPAYEVKWEPALDNHGRLSFEIVANPQQACNTQCLYMGVAAELYGEDNVLVNRRCMDISKEIIKARPHLYFQWLRKSLFVGVKETLTLNYLLGPHLLPFGLILLGSYSICIIGRLRAALPEVSGSVRTGTTEVSGYCLELVVMTLLAVGFMLANILVVSLVAYPTGRYAVAGGIFLPGMAIAAVFVVGQQIGLVIGWSRRDDASRRSLPRCRAPLL